MNNNNKNIYNLTSVRDQTLAGAFVLVQFIQETMQFWTSCTNSVPKLKANLKLIKLNDRCEVSLTKPHQYPDKRTHNFAHSPENCISLGLLALHAP